MVRSTLQLSASLFCLSFSLSCSTLGAEAGEAEGYPHGGTGPYRVLSSEEVGLAGSPSGRALVIINAAFDSASISASGDLFYALAPLGESPEDEAEDQPEGDVNWDLLESRQIYRSAPSENLAFVPGEVVLSAPEHGEGFVTDPWALEMPDSSIHLFYRDAAGIALATANNVAGPYTRSAVSPVLELTAPSSSERMPAHPSVIADPSGGYLMYFAYEDGIGIASSEDGISFVQIDGDPEREGTNPLNLSELSEQVQLGAPAAILTRTPTGREIIRLYLEGREEGLPPSLFLAASTDGQRFDTHPQAIMLEGDRRSPAPFLINERQTLLYHSAPHRFGNRNLRGLAVAIAPSSISLLPDDDD